MRTIFLGMAGLAVLTAPAAGQGFQVMHPEGVYTQTPTGMTYPEAVDQFHRVSVIRYKPDGSDESAGYNYARPMNEISATIYVFPSPPPTSIGSPASVVADAQAHLCQLQFQGVEREVKTAHPDAVLVKDGPFVLNQEGKDNAGFVASYDLTNRRFAGRTDVASRSDAYLFCFAGGRWTVEYRFDYPRDSEAGPAIAGFMHDLAWTIRADAGK